MASKHQKAKEIKNSTKIIGGSKLWINPDKLLIMFLLLHSCSLSGWIVKKINFSPRKLIAIWLYYTFPGLYFASIRYLLIQVERPTLVTCDFDRLLQVGLTRGCPLTCCFFKEMFMVWVKFPGFSLRTTLIYGGHENGIYLSNSVFRIILLHLSVI